MPSKITTASSVAASPPTKNNTVIPLEEAIGTFHEALERAGALSPMPSETVPLDQALGRVTAEPIWACISSPHYDAAAMDGVAVRARETTGATETSPANTKYWTIALIPQRAATVHKNGLFGIFRIVVAASREYISQA